jgi:uncharacterized protein (TIGR02996 family)
MSDAAALLAAIRAAPDDDAPRLVYADWLDEHGQPERAEFIRVQIELARNESAELRRREAELLPGYHYAFASSLGPHGLRFRFHRGFVVGFGHTGVFAASHGTSIVLLRLFPDGVVIGTTTRSSLEAVTGHFDRSNKFLMRGTYELGSFDLPLAISFVCEARSARENLKFQGVLDGPSLLPDAHSRIKGYPLRRRFEHVHIDGVDSFSET